jgi:tRNA(Ile)-lysidine synthase
LDLLEAGSLEARLERGQGVRIPQDARVTVRFRQGGERCRIAGQSRLLKKQLQAWQVPPWLRDRVPLLYVNGELAAVADLCICEGFQAREQQQGFVVKWCRP